MTQIQVKDKKIDIMRNAMMKDPHCKMRDLKHDSTVIDIACDYYMMKYRDRELVKIVVDDLINRGIIR